MSPGASLPLLIGPTSRSGPYFINFKMIFLSNIHCTKGKISMQKYPTFAWQELLMRWCMIKQRIFEQQCHNIAQMHPMQIANTPMEKIDNSKKLCGTSLRTK